MGRQTGNRWKENKGKAVNAASLSCSSLIHFNFIIISLKHCEPRSLRRFHYIITLSVIASRPNNVLRAWHRWLRWIFWQSFIGSLLRFATRWNGNGPETDGEAFKSALRMAQKWRNTTSRLPEKCNPEISAGFFNPLSSLPSSLSSRRSPAYVAMGSRLFICKKN